MRGRESTNTNAKRDPPAEAPEATAAPAHRPCPAPVRPVAHNAAAAERAGCADEWSDRMKTRYGGEW
jgi:hypothetical protein